MQRFSPVFLLTAWVFVYSSNAITYPFKLKDGQAAQPKEQTLLRQTQTHNLVGLTKEQSDAIWQVWAESTEKFLGRCAELGIIKGKNTPAINFFSEFVKALQQLTTVRDHAQRAQQAWSVALRQLNLQNQPTAKEKSFLLPNGAKYSLDSIPLARQTSFSNNSVASVFRVRASRSGEFIISENERLAGIFFGLFFDYSGYHGAGYFALNTQVQLPHESASTPIRGVRFSFPNNGPTAQWVPNRKQMPHGIAKVWWRYSGGHFVEAVDSAKRFFWPRAAPSTLGRQAMLDLVLLSSRFDEYFDKFESDPRVVSY